MSDANSALIGTESTSSPGLSVSIQLDCAERINFAMQQHRIPLVRRVSLTNSGSEPVSDLTISLALANGEARQWTRAIARIGPGETYNVEPEDFVLAATSVSNRSEAERTEVLAVAQTSQGRADASVPVELLPFDHWPGSGTVPELLASFVTPNHPAIAELLGAARPRLAELAGSDALDGYQSGSRMRASCIATACFDAAGGLNVGYINPPASFEAAGQRIRLADQIVRERLATCIDLSLLLAGLWEQAGLHPLIVLLKDHALPAVWTHDQAFDPPVIDEVARLRNHIQLGSIIAVESTILTHGNKSFAEAVAAARSKIDPAGEALIIDIHAARKLGVRPLPLRFDHGVSRVDPDGIHSQGPASFSEAVASTLEIAERAALAKAWPSAKADESPKSRVERWKRKLLDLSLRNRLLNFRESGRVVTLNVPNLAQLEDGLAEGGSFAILPKISDDPEFLLQQLSARKVHAKSGEGSLGKSLLELFRIAKSSIEETGANLLHLAIGSLVWYESESSEQARTSPLILLPITLSRVSTGSGYLYSLALSEEPIRPNVTLLEKLRNDFGISCDGLDEFPEDEHGIDVKLVLHRFREAIRETKRWEVEETASIGLFSFNKFLMWRDLQVHSERLKDNRLVGHLMGSGSEAFDRDVFPNPRELDSSVAPGDLLCTRDADSSQLAAIMAAKLGRTFVLQGPPGTGKSQTIANMIADAVGSGKRVLFVAEKMAALSVVRRRLEQDGLGPACLELHSAKASKKEVLDQLRRALESGSTREPADWSAVVGELAETRTVLNDYVRELHATRASGESLFRVLGRVARLGEGPAAPCPSDSPASVTAEVLGGWRSQLTRLVNAAGPVHPLVSHPYRHSGRTEWGFALPDQVRGAVQVARVALESLHKAAQAWLASTDPAASPSDPERLDTRTLRAFLRAASTIPSSPKPHPPLLTGPEWSKARSKLLECVELGRDLARRRASLLQRVRPEWLDLDALKTIDEAKRARAALPILRWFATQRVIRSVRHLVLDPKPRVDGIIRDLDETQELKRLSARLNQVSPAVEKWVGSARWNHGDPEWDAIERDVKWADQFRTVLDEIGTGPVQDWLRGVLVREAAAGPNDSLRCVLGAWDAWCQAWSAIATLLCLDEDAVNAGLRSQPWHEALQHCLDQWSEHLDTLNDWVTWRHTRLEASKAGLDRNIQFFESTGLPPSEWSDAFERGCGSLWIPQVADSVEAIRRFNLAQHERTLERFRRADTELLQRTQQLVAARAAAGVPTSTGVAVATSELGILKRELEKKRKHLPTRKLIESLPSLLPRLKPCFLMSPLSVAQYLDTKLPNFDLVIFDEASQIPVWDAIGALARGDESIVVGDSKQLPPTAFFATLDSEEEEPEPGVVEDLESILQECEASDVPSMRLKWHYRSRHESLIAFSNHHYYNNELHTFPSPADRSDSLGVTLRLFPNAIYDRGGSRQNRVEAEAVVREVLRRLRLGKEHASIGVVTFGSPQQVLIEDLLDAARREHPEIEEFFSGSEEPVFVKSLENVQGDERDTIIFSIGYGRDQAGKTTMNFGPINQNGGERRLNVAITRARQQLIVFSSIRAEDIDLGRTQAVGVRHLKTFLDYAARGPKAIAEAVELTRNREFDSGFERAVFDALTERGWRIDTQVGCAGFRIDLAVVHPDLPGRYAIGIECDGASYHSAQTARDRDRLRAAVLKGLGWRLTRVWSTDWRIDRRRCVESIERAIKAALLDTPTELLRSEPAPPASVAPAPTEDRPSPPEDAREPDPTPPQSATLPQYRTAQPPRRIPSEADIADPAYLDLAVECVAHIVAVEHPITPGVAIRRLAGWFGIQRIRERTEQRLHEVIRIANERHLIRAFRDALWPEGANPVSYDEFRVPGPSDGERRDAEDIPLVERVAAARYILRAHFGMPREDLEREVARVFGAQRLTPRIQEAVGQGVDALIGSGGAVAADGSVSLPPP